jgi:nitrate/TMAO reductase-like tetraheme cytochrome c subunit
MYIKEGIISEMSNKSIMAAIACLVLTLLVANAEAAEPKWDDCIGCHAERAESVEAPYVDPATLDASVHKGLSCRDCHSDIREVDHVVDKTTHQRYPEKVSCIEKCHIEGNEMGAPDFSPMKQYKDSVHGIATDAGMADAATCTDCHGRHNIKPKDDPESTVYRANIPRTCAGCHEDMKVVVKHHIHAEKPFEEYEQSVHGKALYRDGLIKIAAVCTDCHGVHNIQPAGTPLLRPRRPETCGRCHIGILNIYEESSHGIAAIKEKNSDAPVCADCHGEHTIAIPFDGEISVVCSKCHAEEGIMAKYDIPIDRSVTYKKSYHGVASSYGSQTVANCSSCHDYHNIRPPDDPKSSINPDNLVKTCGQPGCHPGISAKVASAKMHVDATEKESGSLYYVRKIFVWAFVGLLIISFFWVIPDIARRIRRRGAD